MDEMDAALGEFLVESYENLDGLDRDLIALEKNPRDADRLASVFRTIHTIKGTCGFFELSRLGALTHAGENLLALLRDGRIGLSPRLVNALLALVDAVRRCLRHIEDHRAESDETHAGLIATLNDLADGSPASADAGPAASDDIDLSSGLADGTLRVDVGLLDKLMNLVGELVLSRNQILQVAGLQKDPTLAGASQRLNLITTELQEGVMKTRMQPIGNVWGRFPRVVRDLARSCGKEVRVAMEGQETELDKTILEAIKGPLTHLVRNAVDHGLESGPERKAAGKPEAGLLTLRAYHEGGQVNIEVRDDGRGMSAERIRHKAVERGLIPAEQAARLTEREVLRLIFLPGFSTAEAVTSLSGRGVGMDVVKTNVEKIGGTVDVQSRPGEGAAVKLKIPLTLAIIPALLVTSGGDRYAIPQVNLLELVHLNAEQATRQIESLYGAPVYRLRGKLLPLVYLDRLLGAPGASKTEGVNIVVVQADDRPFGLVVDAVHDTEEIVVKPLGKHLKGIPVFAGATIMGDGGVALILDLLGIAQTSGVIAEARRRAAPSDAPAKAGEALHSVLVFEARPNYRVCLPLGNVARLEEVPRDAVETASGRPVVQYRDEILPLVHFPTPPAEPGDGPLQVVVCADGPRRVGLVVNRILDIVQTPLDVRFRAGEPGVVGTAVVQQRVTDLLDVSGVVNLAWRAAP